MWSQGDERMQCSYPPHWNEGLIIMMTRADSAMCGMSPRIGTVSSGAGYRESFPEQRHNFFRLVVSAYFFFYMGVI
jgi:hypothetical protein